MNGSDWQILAGNEERIVIYCLTRAGSFFGVSRLVNYIFMVQIPALLFSFAAIFSVFSEYYLCGIYLFVAVLSARE